MKIRTMLMISAMLFAILPMVIYTVFANTLLSSDGDKQFRDTLIEVAENERCRPTSTRWISRRRPF